MALHTAQIYACVVGVGLGGTVEAPPSDSAALSVNRGEVRGHLPQDIYERASVSGLSEHLESEGWPDKWDGSLFNM